MSKKRTSLDAIVSRTFKESTAADIPPAATPVPTPTADAGRRPLTKQQTVYLPIPVYEQLRSLAFDERGKMHDYLLEGLGLVFQKRGLPAINELKKRTP